MTAIDRFGRPLRDNPFRGHVRAAATAALTLAGLQSVDGVMLETGDRVLVLAQANPADNGVYLAQTGLWPRARDLATADDFSGPVIITVEEGTAGRNSFYTFLPAGPVTVGATPITFSEGLPEEVLGDGAALSVLGRASNTTGPRADIVAGSDGAILRRSGTVLGFGNANASFVEVAQPGPGAVTRTVAAKFSESLSVLDYGAAGNGSTDDTAAFQNAFNRATVLGGAAIKIPKGRYRLTGPVTLPDTKIEIFGEPGAVIELAHATAGIFLTYDMAPANPQFVFNIHDLDFKAVSGGTISKAISVVGTAEVWGLVTLIQGQFERLRFYSSTGIAPIENFNSCIYVKNVWAPRYIDVSAAQVGNTTGTLFHIDNDNIGSGFFTYGAHFIRAAVNGGQYAIKLNGSFEEIYIVDPQIVGSEYGFHWDGSGGFAGQDGFLTVHGGHWNCRRTNVTVLNNRGLRISGADLYHGVGGGTDIDAPIVVLQNVNTLGGSVISGCTICTATGSATNVGLIEMTGCDKVLISSNNIIGAVGGSIGVKMTNCTACTVSSNIVKDDTGVNVYAYQIVNSTDVTVANNSEVGWTTVLNESGNTRLRVIKVPTSAANGTVVTHDSSGSVAIGGAMSADRYRIHSVDFAYKNSIFHVINSPDGSQSAAFGNDANVYTSDSHEFYNAGIDTRWAYLTGDGLTLGTIGQFTGKARFQGLTSGTITIQAQAAAGTYNFNLPIAAGAAGQPLLSGGGGVNAMVFGTLSIGAGGTGATTAQSARSNLGLASATTDNTIVRFDGSTGQTQGSTTTIGDNGALTVNGTSGALISIAASGSNINAFYQILSATASLTFGVNIDNSGYVFTAGEFAIHANSAERFRASSSAFRPVASAIYSLGTASLQWSTTYSGNYFSGANQVVSARKTGWATPTGTATRTTFDTSTVTTSQLAERVKALIDDLHATAGHGLIGA
jgi:hypothetical protein